jgi:glutathione synthase/RimK-type ligase-like ATP-grasp enzyme
MFLLGWFKTRKLEDLALSAAMYLQHHGKLVLNSEALNNRSRSKLSQLVAASIQGIKTGEYVAINEPGQLEQFFSKLSFSFPVIAKSASASRGDNNYLAQNFEELQVAVNTMPTKMVTIGLLSWVTR